MKNFRLRDGFVGEKLISLPDNIIQSVITENPLLSHLFITHIGYFPMAIHHHIERKNGCSDNILIYCVRGKGWYTINGKCFEVHQNHFFVLPAGNEHSYGSDENVPWTIYWIHFRCKDIDVFNKGFSIDLLDSPNQILYNVKGIELWHSIYNNLEIGYSKENITKANLYLYHFIFSFLYPDANICEAEENSISKTIGYMKSNLSKKLSLEDLALINNLSISHFSMLFKKYTGMSPMDYFIHLKLQQACKQLLTSEIKVKNIAAGLGYDDPFYFSRLFKKNIKKSPLQYRFSGFSNLNFKK